MKKTELRENIAEHIFNVIMSCSDATVEEAGKMAHNETMPILSIVREAVSAVKPREIRTTPYVSGKKPTRTSTKAKWHNKAISDYHDALIKTFT